MEWSKFYAKTFKGPFFLGKPAWVRGLWATLQEHVTISGGEASIDVAIADCRQSKRRPTSEQCLHIVRAMSEHGMVELFSKDGFTHYRLKNWEKYQQRHEICSSDRKRDRKRDRKIERGGSPPPPPSKNSLSAPAPGIRKSFRQIDLEIKQADVAEIVRKAMERQAKGKNGNGNHAS